MGGALSEESIMPKKTYGTTKKGGMKKKGGSTYKTTKKK